MIACHHCTLGPHHTKYLVTVTNFSLLKISQCRMEKHGEVESLLLSISS